MPTPDAIRRRLQEAIAYVRARIYTIENDYAARQLLSAYQDALVEMQKRVDATFAANGSGEWSTRDANYLRRTNDLMNGISSEMEALNVKTHNTLIDEQIRAYRASYYGNAWIVDKFSAPDFSPMLPVIPHEAVRAQLLYPYEGNTTWFRMEANRADFINQMRRSLLASQIQGETVYEAQKRLSDALGLPIARRKLSDRQSNSGNFNRTEMIARTELLRSSNLGSHAVYEANSDVVKEWEYLATLDARTCAICGPLDGRRYPLGDTESIPPTHP